MTQTEVAARVGFYDQSLLHRHFKRILGFTPGAFVRATT
jgi:AraC-like DNA-binding protein